MQGVSRTGLRLFEQPSFEAVAVGIELVLGLKTISEDPPDSCLRLTITAQASPSYLEDQSTVPFEEGRQGIVATAAQRIHQICIGECSKPTGGTNQGRQFVIRQRNNITSPHAPTITKLWTV